MTAASFSRRSWSETAGGTAASGEAGLWLIDAPGVEFDEGVEAPVAVAVEWDDESYSLPGARSMTSLEASGLEEVGCGRRGIWGNVTWRDIATAQALG